MSHAPCRICQKPAVAFQLCNMHYMRMRRGAPLEAPAKGQAEVDKSLWTEANIAWVAGIIEGEGNFGFSQKRYPQVTVVSTDLDVLERVRLITAIGNITGPKTRGNPKHKPYWKWCVTCTKHAVELIHAILPWLCKRRRAAAEKLLVVKS